MTDDHPPRLDAYKVLVAGFMLALLFGALTWLQNRFNASDLTKATEIVRGYKQDSRTLLEQIRARHPGVEPDEISWSSEILSSCLGHVRVYANLPAKGGRPAETFAFDVDLGGPSVHPTDPKTVEILRALSSSTARSNSSTAARPR
jgi:hypothetical protein